MTYKELRDALSVLFEQYNAELVAQDHPYRLTFALHRLHRASYGDERICECGHTYIRHFDTYESMEPAGCKYCDCVVFMEGSGREREHLSWTSRTD